VPGGRPELQKRNRAFSRRRTAALGRQWRRILIAVSAAKQFGEVRIGISGWRYKGWRGAFYPKDLPQRRELEYAAGIFGSVEINGTFYSLQRPESFARWAAATPDEFVFAVKGSRYITHMLQLTKFRKPLANFFASGVLRLGKKLGPILWQFPQQFRFNTEKIEAFFDALPRDTSAAVELARRHDKRVSGRSWLRIDENGRLRYAMEVRHPSFACPEFVKLLRRYGIALVCADAVAWPRLMDVTSDFMYCRLHGSEQLYASGYDDKALDQWAARVAAWARGGEAPDGERASAEPAPKRARRDVYVYFDNDAKVRAPVDAQGLIERVARLLHEPLLRAAS
jgi:uncharacterized protein YecE (DUF72 family)